MPFPSVRPARARMSPVGRAIAHGGARGVSGSGTKFFQRTGALPAISSGCDPDKVHVVPMGHATWPLGSQVLR
eukprot:2822121-Prymnesium_polylepis.2